MVEVRVYKCNLCGNLVSILDYGGGTLVCCGQEMEELVANTVDASQEKHVPQITREGNKVTITVGSVIHPMEEAHYIGHIFVATKNFVHRKVLKPGEEPIMEIDIDSSEPIVAYEWCNLHGLWKNEG